MGIRVLKNRFGRDRLTAHQKEMTGIAGATLVRPALPKYLAYFLPYLVLQARLNYGDIVTGVKTPFLAKQLFLIGPVHNLHTSGVIQYLRSSKGDATVRSLNERSGPIQ
jgi:hypothetical protein